MSTLPSPPQSVRGRFITFEGIEGSGKSTQLRRVAERLRAGSVEPVLTKEPGGTPLGLELRRVLLGTHGMPISPESELMLYAADRAQHVLQVVAPALETGRIVLCDRYLDATLAYQGYGRGLGVEPVLRLHAAPPLDLRPVRTLLLDLPADLAVDRARRRNDRDGTADEGRFEAEALAFHRRVRDGYLELAGKDPERYRVIDATGDEDAVEARVVAALGDLVPELLESAC